MITVKTSELIIVGIPLALFFIWRMHRDGERGLRIAQRNQRSAERRARTLARQRARMQEQLATYSAAVMLAQVDSDLAIKKWAYGLIPEEDAADAISDEYAAVLRLQDYLAKFKAAFPEK